jgi:hypothetical protein
LEQISILFSTRSIKTNFECVGKNGVIIYSESCSFSFSLTLCGRTKMIIYLKINVGGEERIDFIADKIKQRVFL